MKTVLAIIGSPRKLGNCEIIAKEISRNIAEPHTLKLLRLSDFNLQPCIGCYTCLIKQKGCVLEDDFNTVAEAVTQADALIVAVPTYFLGANSSLKRLSDRGLALYAHARELWGKPAIGIGVAGIEGKEGYTLLGIESFLKLLLTDLKQCRIVYGALPGEVFLNEANRKTAARMAKALFTPAPTPVEPCCPLCGGQTFRFMGDGRVMCMLCSNSGSMSMPGDQPVFQIDKSKHDLFLTRQNALEHREWLVGMKSRFLKHKNELKKISLDYRQEGTWIKP